MEILLLKQDAHERRALMGEVKDAQVALTETIHGMDKKLDTALRLADSTIPERVRSLEISRAEALGGKAMLAAMLAAASSVAAIFGGWVSTMFRGNPPTH